MRISDWSSDVCSSDLAQEVVLKFFGRYRTAGAIERSNARPPADPLDTDNLRRRDCGVLIQVILDFPGFNSDSTDLQLVVQSAVEPESACLIHAAEVAGQIDEIGRAHVYSSN